MTCSPVGPRRRYPSRAYCALRSNIALGKYRCGDHARGLLVKIRSRSLMRCTVDVIAAWLACGVHARSACPLVDRV